MNDERKKLYKSLAKLAIWIPVEKAQESGFSLTLLQNGNGEGYLPVFKSKESNIGDFQKEKLVQMDFETIRYILVDLPKTVCGIVVEPFGENLILTRSDLLDFDSEAKGMSVVREEHAGKITLTVPNQLPKGMITALERFFDGYIGVNRAWVLLAKEKHEKTPHLLFVVDFLGSKIDLFPKLAEVIKPFMKPGQQFELNDHFVSAMSGEFDRACVYRRKAAKCSEPK